jgi:glycosyltransferase involved in cell wall biosynthesis
MSSLTVIICTRNPRPDYLRRTLEALRSQTLAQESWELLLVDNASDMELANEWDLSWHKGARHVREDTIGLTPARLRGIRESYGDLLVFVDDDNVLAADYLSQVLSVSARHPHLGVFGAGTIEPECEIDPPLELVPRMGLVAVRTVGAAVWSNNPKDHSCLPWGAGLCVTRRVAKAYYQLVDRLGVSDIIGRHGHRLFSGDDDLISWAASGLGQGFGLFPELRVTHLILATRLKHGYFLRLIYDHRFSHCVLRYLLMGVRSRRVELWERMRILAHGLKNGRFSMRCQWAELRGEESAANFIEQRRLRPLPELSLIFSTGQGSHASLAQVAYFPERRVLRDRRVLPDRRRVLRTMAPDRRQTMPDLVVPDL